MLSVLTFWQSRLCAMFVLLLLLPMAVHKVTASPAATTVSVSQVVPPHLLADFPTHITLRGGVLHAPPFAIVEPREDGSGYEYGGLQPDLLQRLQVFAAQDGVTLSFDLSPSPPVWDDALDLVAYDCEETLKEYYQTEREDGKDKYSGNDCNTFDLIVGEYTSTPERFLRAEFTPPFLQSAIGAMKYVGQQQQGEDTMPQPKNVATLTQANQVGATVCGQSGSATMRTVMARFPLAQYILCESQMECFEHLQQGECSLLTRDKLSLKGKAFEDPSFEVTAEEFNTYYLVWPMRQSLPPVVSYLMKRWVHRAVRNTTLDELYHKYFEKDLCPVGQAGPNCELPCDADHGAADKYGRCICESTKWSGDDCSIEIEEDLNLIPSALKTVAFAMLGINVAVILACGAWLLSHWNSDEVRASQPSFLLLVLLGCLISSSTILAMAQEDNNGKDPDAACMSIPWLYSVGFCVTFGTLFAKIRRVHLIFRQAALNHGSTNHGSSNLQTTTSSHMTARRKSLAVSFQETLLVIGAVMFVDVAILITWTVVDPLRWERVVVQETQFGEPLESQGYCISDSWEIFFGIIGSLHLCLQATACYLCYKARAIPTRFQEGKYVSIAMLSNLQIFLVGVPILVIVGSDPQSGFFVRAAMIFMNDLAVVLIIFGNLIFRTKMRNVRDSVMKRAVGRAILKYSMDTPDSGVKELRSEHSANSPARNNSGLTMSTPKGSQDHDVAQEPQPEPLAVPDPDPEHEPEPLQCPRDDMISSISMSSEFVDTRNLKGAKERDPVSTRISSLTMGSTKKSSNRSVTFGVASFADDSSVPLGVPLSTPEEDMNCRRLSYDDSVLRFTAAGFHGEPPKAPRRPSSTADVSEADKTELTSENKAAARTSFQTWSSDLSPRRPARMLSTADAPPALDSVGCPSCPNSDMSPKRPARMLSSADAPALDDLGIPGIDNDMSPKRPARMLSSADPPDVDYLTMPGIGETSVDDPSVELATLQSTTQPILCRAVTEPMTVLNLTKGPQLARPSNHLSKSEHGRGVPSKFDAYGTQIQGAPALPARLTSEADTEASVAA